MGNSVDVTNKQTKPHLTTSYACLTAQLSYYCRQLLRLMSPVYAEQQ